MEHGNFWSECCKLMKKNRDPCSFQQIVHFPSRCPSHDILLAWSAVSAGVPCCPLWCRIWGCSKFRPYDEHQKIGMQWWFCLSCYGTPWAKAKTLSAKAARKWPFHEMLRRFARKWDMIGTGTSSALKFASQFNHTYVSDGFLRRKPLQKWPKLLRKSEIIAREGCAKAMAKTEYSHFATIFLLRIIWVCPEMGDAGINPQLQPYFHRQIRVVNHGMLGPTWKAGVAYNLRLLCARHCAPSPFSQS